MILTSRAIPFDRDLVQWFFPISICDGLGTAVFSFVSVWIGTSAMRNASKCGTGTSSADEQCQVISMFLAVADSVAVVGDIVKFICVAVIERKT